MLFYLPGGAASGMLSDPGVRFDGSFDIIPVENNNNKINDNINIIRSQEIYLNQNRDSNLGPPDF